jgi:Kef-type K+ transport system membrane component KefB
VAGVLIGQTRFKAEIDDGIHPLAYSIFVPIFFISIGLQANGRALGNQFGFTITLIAIAIVAKAVGCALFAKWCGFTNQESLRVGIGMISRGEVGLIVAGYGLSNGIIGADVFSASVIMVLVTTMVTPPLLRLVFPRSVLIPTSVEETIGHVPRLPEWDVSSDETEDASTRA